jgi:ABC-type phosphate transport system substrate-binding protein
MQRAWRVPFILTVAVSLLGIPAPPAKGEAGLSQSVAIVVNQANPVQDLSSAELRKIFLGERSHWANGRRITLVMMEPGTPERKLILREVCRISEDDLNRHFLRGLFTGEVFVSPKTLATPAGVRRFVFNVPGAIGYLRVNDLDSSVRVVRVDGRLPDEKDYRLQLSPQSNK